MHPAFHIHLGQPVAGGVEVEQAEDLQVGQPTAQQPGRGGEDVPGRGRIARREIEVGRLQGGHAWAARWVAMAQVWWGTSTTASRPGALMGVAATKSAGSSKSKTRPSARSSSGIGVERAERLVEIDQLVEIGRVIAGPARPAACANRRQTARRRTGASFGRAGVPPGGTVLQRAVGGQPGRDRNGGPARCSPTLSCAKAVRYVCAQPFAGFVIPVDLEARPAGPLRTGGWADSRWSLGCLSPRSGRPSSTLASWYMDLIELRPGAPDRRKWRAGYSR